MMFKEWNKLPGNSPFPNCLKPLYQSEAWCTTIHMKMSLIYMWMKSHFHMKRWAPRLALRKRLKVIRKWPILPPPCRHLWCLCSCSIIMVLHWLAGANGNHLFVSSRSIWWISVIPVRKASLGDRCHSRPANKSHDRDNGWNTRSKDACVGVVF